MVLIETQSIDNPAMGFSGAMLGLDESHAEQRVQVLLDQRLQRLFEVRRRRMQLLRYFSRKAE